MSLANPEIDEIIVDGTKLIKIDLISYEYAQQDSEASGNSEDGTMYRDVIGLKNKIYLSFLDPELRSGSNLDTILSLLSESSFTVNYYDRRKKERVSTLMYFVCDKIKSQPCKIGSDEFIAEPFEARFIQMTIDPVS
jgi:hypothetical protein